MSNLKNYRVLHVIPGFGGGISSFVRNIASGLVDSNVTIDVAGFTDYPSDYKDVIEAQGGQTFVLKNVRLRNVISCIKEFRLILKNGQYDAIHMHLSPIQDIYFSIWSSSVGIQRKIVHAHQSSPGENPGRFYVIRHWLDQCLTRMSGTEFVSCSRKATEYRFGKRYLNRDLVTYIPNSIDAGRYLHNYNHTELEQLAKSLHLTKNALTIGHVGYFGYEKNHHFMLKVIQRMKQRNISFQWVFVGAGAKFERCKKIAKDLNIEDCVTFTGRRSDVPQLMQLFDVFVLPSISEGLPTVAVEAQAAGTPVVMSDSVTEECDMKIGLLRSVSLNSSIDLWIDQILESANTLIPKVKTRSESIANNGFTAKEAANRYVHFLLERSNVEGVCG